MMGSMPEGESDVHLEQPEGAPGAFGMRQRLGWVVGPALLLVTLVVPPPAGLTVEGWRTAGAAGLMAVFWIAESIPIPATALLPLVLFPALGLGDIRESAAPFANPIIFLFLGGFLIALAMQRWHLHRRVAIGLIARIGTRPSRIIAGFLLASALVSSCRATPHRLARCATSPRRCCWRSRTARRRAGWRRSSGPHPTRCWRRT